MVCLVTYGGAVRRRAELRRVGRRRPGWPWRGRRGRAGLGDPRSSCSRRTLSRT